ncbi:mitochondrial carrier protein domain-containing protein [Ditylenchus destructor]|uniref:Mitochondrial carrier protein domain-containing protein n=1 Tax=Ditylenchus destructor TaxID=166010 RepID=A0AAD4N0T0_9BILA|nr:mitochondrial carrier protein domain-containing protein [Ditylenchus destructor]
MKTDGTLQEQAKSSQYVISSFISGALAAALAKTVIAPLDNTKLAFQISTSKKYSLKAALSFIRDTYHNYGFTALFRGNSAQMARIMPFAAFKFGSFEVYNKLLHVDEHGNLTPWRRLCCGTLAGLTATCITYPLDRARARLATMKEYKNLIDVFLKDYRRFGGSCFYVGMFPSLLGIIPYSGVSFFTYGTLRIHYKEYFGKDPGALENFGFGAISGVGGQILAYPLDIVRRRMQTGRLPPNEGVFFALFRIYRTEGFVGGLYKGLSMNWIKGPIASGIVFASYEFLKRFFVVIKLQ